MIRFAQQCLAIGSRDLSIQRTYGLSALLAACWASLGLIAYYFIGRLVDPGAGMHLAGGSYFAFVWSGISVQLLVAACMGALGGALAREAAEGTLETALMAGAPLLALVVGGALAPLLLAAAQLAIHAGVGVALFELDFTAARIAPACAALLATVVSCAPIGLLGAAIWLRLRRAGIVTTAALFAFGVVGGIYFPVELLPAPLPKIASWIPFTIGLEAVRGALLEGAGWRETLPALARLLVLTAVALPISLLALHRCLERAQRTGRLALV